MVHSHIFLKRYYKKIVVNGAGASAQACTELFKNSGVPNKNVIMLDRKGVIYKGRTEGMDQWKSI